MRTSPVLRIGVDGGASKTELLLVDPAGVVLARHVGPGCNPSHGGPEAAGVALRGALDTLLAAAGVGPAAVARTNLYMAGSTDFWREFAAAETRYGRMTAGPDSLPVLELATDGAPGLALHAGTGSFVAARGPDGAVHYAGGLGWRLGDPGSGLDLGRRGLARALLELQGWAPPSALGAALRAESGGDAAAVKRALYADAAANARLAAFGRRVLELAGAGCAPAYEALAASVGELLDQARLVGDRLFVGTDAPACGVCGPILNAPPTVALLRSLAAARGWKVAYRFVTAAPAEGVRRLLLKD